MRKMNGIRTEFAATIYSRKLVFTTDRTVRACAMNCGIKYSVIGGITSCWLAELRYCKLIPIMETNFHVEDQDRKAEDTLGCLFAILCAVALPLFTRFFHWLLIPQVLEENAYFVGKAPYLMMYMLSVPAGFLLGMVTALAWPWRNKNPEKAKNYIWVTGFLAVFIILQGCHAAYKSRNVIPSQANWAYMLAVYLPWYGPIFLWGCILLFWTMRLSKRTK